MEDINLGFFHDVLGVLLPFFTALTVPLVGNFMFLNRHNGMVVVLPHP
ncbi:hypothetical protein HMPREF0733_11763 [Rothia dentocariosa ATCC 17931]|uniref:Uncharacterized protein n=1 Tax=Rothia dentocariosa (strain ATCC 17931 / CDC X599 / XDIA) TaxID=762948 RepID=E3H1J7_ROTDC|nr:hypothetical protein HMPREF0733_11763 [Rothia dentocariosa ATCC 17931]